MATEKKPAKSTGKKSASKKEISRKKRRNFMKS